MRAGSSFFVIHYGSGLAVLFTLKYIRENALEGTIMCIYVQIEPLTLAVLFSGTLRNTCLAVLELSVRQCITVVS